MRQLKRVLVLIALAGWLTVGLAPHAQSFLPGQGGRAAQAKPIASYQIQVTLDPAARSLRGHQVLTLHHQPEIRFEQVPRHRDV